MWRSRTRRSRSCSGSSDASGLRSTGAASASRWTRAPRGPSAVAFKRLYRDGLAYRTEALDQLVPGLPDERQRPRGHPDARRRARCGPSATTSIDEATGAPDPNETITVATTRPETILGDTAVAVHPDDARYARLVGRQVRIPFVERDVPIIADDVVERDVRDRRGQDHACPRPRRLRDRQAPRPADDHDPRRRRDDQRDRRAVRRASTATTRGQRILADLRARGDLVGRAAARDGHRPLPAQQRRHRAAPQDAVVHPDRAAGREGARAATRDGRTRILPARFEKTWEHWLTNIRDWNVSRQLWWGHRIPAWYCPDGHVTVSSEPDGPAGVRGLRPARRPSSQQDPDIFDTWFSSGLWPFSTLGWPDDDAGLRSATTRRRSWRRATTSSSSGSPG